MNNKIKAVIWDMGGVLLREFDPLPRLQLAAQYHLTLDQLNQFVFQSESAKLSGLGFITEDEHWDWLRQKIGVRLEDLEDFRLKFWSGDRVDRQLACFIDGLKADYQTALLSNAGSEARRAFRDYYGCIDLFHHVIISAEVKMAKPDPAIFREMLSSLQIRPDQSIFVDDLQENIDAANALGINGIRFFTTDQAIADVRNLLG